MLKRVDVSRHRLGRASWLKGWHVLCSLPNTRMLRDRWSLSKGVQHFLSSLLPTQYHLSDLSAKLCLLIGRRRKTFCRTRRTHINSMVILWSTSKTKYLQNPYLSVISSTDKIYYSTQVYREPFSLITEVIESPLVLCYALSPDQKSKTCQDRPQRNQPLWSFTLAS